MDERAIGDYLRKAAAIGYLRLAAHALDDPGEREAVRALADGIEDRLGEAPPGTATVAAPSYTGVD